MKLTSSRANCRAGGESNQQAHPSPKASSGVNTTSNLAVAATPEDSTPLQHAASADQDQVRDTVTVKAFLKTAEEVISGRIFSFLSAIDANVPLSRVDRVSLVQF
jgi:uncharacterized protein (DUF1778 family)